MEFIGILSVLRRWLWLIIIIVGATIGFLFLSSRAAKPTYNARATVQITTPDPEDIAIFYERNYISDRDEITIALNKFISIAQFSEVKKRTLEKLKIDEDYELETGSELGADFVFINAIASTPELAQSIANTHASQAIELFGELRVRPLNQALVYFNEQLELARQEVTDAEKALVDFQLEHGISSIQDELNIQNRVLRTLKIAQAKFDFTSVTNGPSRFASGSYLESLLNDDESQPELVPRIVGELIRSQRKNLTDIARLEPTYNSLVEGATNAQRKYDTLAEKHTETEIKASFAKQSFFVQVMKSASLPKSAESSLIKTLVFGLAGSIGFAILLVFVLDYLFSSKQVES